MTGHTRSNVGDQADRLALARLLERVAAAADAPDLEAAAPPVIDAVCEYAGWSVGHLYVVADDGGPLLVPTPVWSPAPDPDLDELRRLTERSPLRPGEDLPGRVLATAGPASIPDLAADGAVARAAAAGRAGLRAGFAIPVAVGREVAAVVEFFAPRPGALDEVVLRVSAHAGHQLARVVERQRAAEAQRAAEEHYRALTRSARDAIVSIDEHGLVVGFNHAAEAAFGYAEEEILGASVTTLMPARFRSDHRAGMLRFLSGGRPRVLGHTLELVGLRRDGREFPVELSLSTWTSPRGRFFTGILRDITERKVADHERAALTAQLAERALRDPLTDLPNRALLQDRLQHALARAERRRAPVAVASIDIDRFRVVNDTMGHAAGDHLLGLVAQRLTTGLRPDDTVARVGGDEFVVVLDDVGGTDEAVATVRAALARLAHELPVHGQAVPVTVSTGIAVSQPGAGEEADQLIRNAEVARERALRAGPGQVVVFDAAMRAETARRVTAEGDLRRALSDGQLLLVYQPVVDLGTGLVAGVEALLRWHHPTRGLVTPLEFIPLAEETGLIIPIGHWVLSEAARQAAAWNRDRPPGRRLRMGVNVSPLQVQQIRWAEEVAEVVRASGIEPGDLVLEITESVLVDDPEITARRLAEVRALGVRIAVDDFGTGYSSLAFLRRFPVDVLKIDKMFIDGVAADPQEAALAQAVVRLAATMHLDAVAEGVAAPEQYEALVRMRCPYGQGFLFAEPQEPDAVVALFGDRDLRPGVARHRPRRGGR